MLSYFFFLLSLHLTALTKGRLLKAVGSESLGVPAALLRLGVEGVDAGYPGGDVAYPEVDAVDPGVEDAAVLVIYPISPIADWTMATVEPSLLLPLVDAV